MLPGKKREGEIMDTTQKRREKKAKFWKKPKVNKNKEKEKAPRAKKKNKEKPKVKLVIPSRGKAGKK